MTAFLFFGMPADLYSQTNGEATHQVRSGDTLYSISRQYDISVTELREWNDLEGDNLESGMTLQVAPPKQDTITHTVSSQETLFSISRQYNVSIAEIQQWNDLESTLLSTGQELVIHSDGTNDSGELPEPIAENNIGVGEDSGLESSPELRESIVAPTTAANTYYTVQSGDYLNRIASEHGMTTDELRRLNNLESDVLSVGQRLIVRETRSTPVVDDDFEESTPQGRFVNYRLEPNENRAAILERFSMTEGELEALNPGTDTGSLSQGQRVTILLPPTRTFENPYRKESGLLDLGETSVSRYDEGAIASPTTSGELYNPDQLTAAHPNMALGSIVFVENPENGRGSYIKINDRISENGIKLSRRAYDILGYETSGAGSAVIYQNE